MNLTATTPATSSTDHRPRRRLLAIVVSVGLMLGIGSALNPARAGAATFGSVYVVATAQYDCGAHTITVWPMTNEPLNGQYSVWSYAQVHDQVTGRWISTSWLLDNGIQGHVFHNMRKFDPYAKVTYARYIYGQWVYKSDWVKITTTLDSMGVFCNP